MSNNSPSDKNYGATSIQVIEGLEAVRKRPAMYIGSTGPAGLHHLVYEVVDNSVDEALAGHCTEINVKLYPDGSCSVEDNGRGIPTDIHPTEGVSAAEVVMTKLHAGGKFDKDSYKFSGGLHGVGISVVNALSEKLYVEIYGQGKVFAQNYAKGKPLERLTVIGETKKRGTLVRFTPDPIIFQETTTFNFDTLSARLRELAFLNKKLKITIDDLINNRSHEFYFEGGIVSFVEYINAKKTPLFKDVLYIENEDDQYMLEIAMQYNDGYAEQLFSFVNNINTVEGGTHVSGFKSALTKICNKRAQELNLLKGESFSSEDVREGLVAVINIKVPEPQFEGQTKTKLGNNDVKGLVDSWTFATLDTYFEEHPTIARAILQKAEMAKRAREAAKKARDLTRRKTALESLILPGKLADCSNENPAETEIFIVEGDSAGGSAKQGRDRNNQAILPLKGKILNVEKARLDKMLSNEEIKALIAAIGCGIGAEFDVLKARYHKIILMTDADVDGSHIRTLLLTFFFRYMKALIEKGYLYIAQPPLYKVKIGKQERYIKDDSLFKQFLFEWAYEHTTLLVDNADIGKEQWHALLNNLDAYEEKLKRLAEKFKISYDHCHSLVVFSDQHPWKEEDNVEQLITKLQSFFNQFVITTADSMLGQETVDLEKTDFEEGVIEGDLKPLPKKPVLKFALANKEWEVDLAFFSSPELALLLDLFKPLAFAQQKEWTVKVIDKERSKTDTGIINLIHAITATSKSFMSVQRYKGLGEMNPEQLWETAMDSTSRTLMKVNIEDAFEADQWFSTLMGDDVAGRKKFIEENGQFAKNLDV